MRSTDFLRLIELLTGTPVKQVGFSEELFLTKALQDDKRKIDASQFNELLLIVNKDRVEPAFFQYFFVKPSEAPAVCAIEDSEAPAVCAIEDIESGVNRFRTLAMLRFGNFIYAYRELSTKETADSLVEKLGQCARNPEDLLKEFKKRSKKVLEVDEIPRDHTFLVGYLSAGEITAEESRARRLVALSEKLDKSSNWESLDQAIISGVREKEATYLKDLVRKYRRTSSEATVLDFKAFIGSDLEKLEQASKELKEVQSQGERNTDIYLSWDHLDVYFATSMRQRWEYEQVNDFINELMADERLKSLDLRYFDPTQSFDKNRINKGLVEALMLKRAKCTVYSIQDTDTIGKDSELAVTLAQGKPVIAYAPDPPEERRTKELTLERPNNLIDRVNFLVDVDKEFKKRFSTDLDFIEQFADKLDEFEGRMLWRSLFDKKEGEQFRDNNSEELEKFCRILAQSEIALYKKRADTLRDIHPLGLQVYLDTGVANGVLVVRSPEKCAELLYRVLTNSMEFEIKENKETKSWQLVESVSNSIFRVVTKDHKLTNCFWNFYKEKL